MLDTEDKLVKTLPLLQMTGGEWEDFLNVKVREEEIMEMQKHEQTGRPLGSASFVDGLEKCIRSLLETEEGGRETKERE